MFDSAIESHAKGEKSGVVEHVPETLNVKAIREKTGMSQQSFCATFGISLGTLRHWEQGLRTPHGAARVLLKVVAHPPCQWPTELSQFRPLKLSHFSRVTVGF